MKGKEGRGRREGEGRRGKERGKERGEEERGREEGILIGGLLPASRGDHRPW